MWGWVSGMGSVEWGLGSGEQVVGTVGGKCQVGSGGWGGESRPPLLVLPSA